MIIGMALPKGTKAITEHEGNLYLVFDEGITKRDLWKAHFEMWLTNGEDLEDYRYNSTCDHKVLEITHKNKIKLA